VLFTPVGKLLGMLQAAKATNAYDRKLSALAKTDLLIVDDFGLKPFKSSEDEDFHDLIAERYERVSTVITSNLDFTEWGEAFNNKLLGAATLDRIRHGAYKIILEGRSYRSSREEAALKNRVAGAEENT
jgi:DNA replication protein DnaC